MIRNYPELNVSALSLVGLLVLSIISAPVTVSAVSADGNAGNVSTDLGVTLSAADSVSAGDTVTVTVAIQNIGENRSPAPVFNLASLPTGWRLSTWSGTDAAYRSSTNEWLWTELRSNSTEQFTFTLATTERASDLTLSGHVSDGYENSATETLRIVVEEASSSDSNEGNGPNRDDSGTVTDSEATTVSQPTATTEVRTATTETQKTGASGPGLSILNMVMALLIILIGIRFSQS